MLPAAVPYRGMDLTFCTGNGCNLRCKYCYEIRKEEKEVPLPLDYAKKFIDLILTDPDPIGVAGTEQEWMLKDGIILDFIGGDPLFYPYLLRDIVKYWIWASTGSKWQNRWRINISTNGTLFNEPGVKEFLEEFKTSISLGVSVDGTPNIHNLNRDNSMDALLLSWDFYKRFSPASTSTKATLNKQSIPYIFESLKFMHEYLGLRYINQNYIMEDTGLNEEDLKIFDSQMELCVDYVRDHKKNIYWSMLDKVSTPMSEPDRGNCGAGSMPALYVDGRIYPCFRFLPHTMSGDNRDLHVGSIRNGFNHKERFAFVRSAGRQRISPPKCLECDVESSCPWCIGGAWSEFGEFKRTTYICELYKIQAKWAKTYWQGVDSDEAKS